MQEPFVKFCTVREGIDENYVTENQIECRFSNGKKYAAVVVDGEMDCLAFCIRDFLNSPEYRHKYKEYWGGQC